MKSKSKLIAIAFAMLVTIGCHKEIIDPDDASGNIFSDITVSNEQSVFDRIKSDGNILIFERIQDYVTVIDEETPQELKVGLLTHIQSLGFDNYFSNHPTEDLLNRRDNPDHVMDEGLGQLLNQDGVIQIENTLYKVDLERKSVFSLPDSLYGQFYEALVAGASDGGPVKKHSIDDDVLVANSSGCGGIGGGVYPSYANVYEGQIIKLFPDSTVWRLNPFARFFRAGIYFRLSSQFEIWRFPSSSHTNQGQIVPHNINISNEGVAIEMFIRWPQGWWKKRPCNEGSVGTKSPGYHYTENLYSKGNKAVYSGIRNLNGYYFFVQGRAKYPDGKVTVATPYGGRNINSPY